MYAEACRCSTGYRYIVPDQVDFTIPRNQIPVFVEQNVHIFCK